MTYNIASPQTIGLLPIANIDAGTTSQNAVSNGSTTKYPTSPMTPGMIIQAQDPTYGSGEFILLLGAASTIVGSLVRYNAVDFSTTLVVNTAVQDVPVAVAMAANTSTTQWAWYQISGTAVLAKTAVIVLPNVPVFISATAGKVRALASAGIQVVACKSQLVTTASASGTVLVTVNRPHLQSQIS